MAPGRWGEGHRRPARRAAVEGYHFRAGLLALLAAAAVADRDGLKTIILSGMVVWPQQEIREQLDVPGHLESGDFG